MASWTNYAVQQVHNGIKTGTNPFSGITWYAAAMKVLPGLDGTGGTEIDSAVNTWYARQAITWDTPILASRSMTTSALITFTSSAASAVTGNIVGTCVFDALTSGNCWFIFPASNAITVGSGSPLTIPIGQLTDVFTTT